MDIVCFANDWDGDPLSKKHIMRRLARHGSRVLWVNSLGNRAPKLGNAKDRARAVRKALRFAASALKGPREVDENIWVVDPIAAPIYRGRWAGLANGALVGLHVRSALARLKMKDAIHYTFIPASAWVAGRIGEQALVYHAADEYAAFGGADHAGVTALEDSLLQKADLYVACSAPLLDNKSGRCRRSMLIRHGVEHEHFAKALDPELPLPEELAGRKGPIVGFIGLIAEWVDLNVMGKIADELERTGGGHVVFVGDVRGADPEALAALRARPNVLLAGRRPYAELPRWCKAFSVATLPFAVNELTISANPLKLREYLAAGLPVVSSDLPESRALAKLCPDDLIVAGTDQELIDKTVRRARAADAGPKAARSQAVAGESWDKKVDELHEILTRTLAHKKETH